MDESDSADSDRTTSDSLSESSNGSSTGTSKKKKGVLPKSPIEEVKTALKKIAYDDFFDGASKTKNKSETKERDFFCIEDTFLTRDLKVSVEGIGQLSFPLDENTIEQMINLSSKAKFGKGKETLLDISVRDTQTIPASKLQVEINNSLDNLLKRVGVGLNIDKNSRLIPHMHNLLIYGPGQFFKKHTDSEKIENMIATLVIILPFPHEGGELVIEHNKKRHMFFGSNTPDIVKCVAFYSDCAHEIKKVTKGYRVAITYNVVLQPPDVSSSNEINDSLNVAVENYFRNSETKLVFGLNHSYSQHSLKWNLMKGADRPRVNALLAVAKKQGKVPCLALLDCHEIYDKENTYYDPEEDPVLVDEDTTFTFMIDENNKSFSSDVLSHTYVHTKEFCYTKKTNELFKPYETEASGPTGNEGDTEEFWYKRACVILWSSKWSFFPGFQEALGEMHQLTKQKGMEKDLLNKINQAGGNFLQPKFWHEPSAAEMLLDIIIYLGDEEKAKLVLGKLCKQIMQEESISRLIQLDKRFDNKMWHNVVKIWKEKRYYQGWDKAVNSAPLLVDNYIKEAGTQFTCNSVVVEQLLEDAVEEFIKSDKSSRINNYVYYRIKEVRIEHLEKLLKVCSLLGKIELQEKLIKHVVSSSYPAVSLGELYSKLMDDLEPEHLSSFEEIKTLVGNAINSCLSELDNVTDWTLPVKATCSCKECSQILMFFNSKTCSSYTAKSVKKSCDHIFEIFYSRLDLFSLPCKMSTKREGRKYNISFEKLPKLLEDRQKLFNDLVQFKKKILSTNHFAFVDVKVEDEDHVEAGLSSEIEITENIKVELGEWTDDSGMTFAPEEVDIKPEIEDCSDESETEQKIPNKRRKIQNKSSKM